MFDINKGLKLKKLFIKKYKIFKDFKIDFTDDSGIALPIIVIAGVNGTGKTTILDTIFDKELDKQSNTSGILHHKNIEKNIDIKVLIDGQEKTLNKSLNKQVSINALRNALKLTDEEIFISDHINYIYINNNFLTDLSQYIPRHIEKLLFEEDVKASEVYKTLSEYILNIFKDMDMSVTFDKMDANKRLYFKNKKGDIFLIDELSTGEQTLFSKVLYLYLLEIKDSVILIDEPELSLHPSWQNRVLKLYENFAKNNNCQIIIATHSPHIIGSAKPEYIRLLVNEKDNIDVLGFDESYGLEFSRILTDIMGVKYLRTPEVGKKLADVKDMIAQNKFNTEEFNKSWKELENIFGEDYLDLKLLKLEIASRKKSVSNN